MLDGKFHNVLLLWGPVDRGGKLMIVVLQLPFYIQEKLICQHRSYFRLHVFGFPVNFGFRPDKNASYPSAFISLTTIEGTLLRGCMNIFSQRKMSFFLFPSIILKSTGG